jgi:hypothetical protein
MTHPAKKEFNEMTLPAQTSPRVAALLARVQKARARLIFALDATASRERTWDLACQLQSEMFLEAAKIGGIEIQLVWYRGENECSHTAWTSHALELATQMRRTRCEAGATKIARVLRHIRSEHKHQKVDAVVFIGDAVEEPLGELYDLAAGLPPIFMFQEGDGMVVQTDQHGQIVVAHSQQKVEHVFRELARLTKGAYGKFDAGAAKQLGELLRAVAAFAVGGLTALTNQRTDSARKLLSQMR